MARLNEIKKQLEALAQPFAVLHVAGNKMKFIVNDIADHSREAGREVLVGAQPENHLNAMVEKIAAFDAALVELQTAIRGVMGSAVMDEWHVSRAESKREEGQRRDDVDEEKDRQSRNAAYEANGGYVPDESFGSADDDD